MDKKQISSYIIYCVELSVVSFINYGQSKPTCIYIKLNLFKDTINRRVLNVQFMYK